MSRTTIILTLEPTTDRFGRTPMYRLRCALKRLGRDYGLKCTRIDYGPADGEDAGDATKRPTKGADDGD